MPIAVYAGTFDPITRGHLSVIERAAPVFERVVVLVAVNPEKQTMFDADERVAMIRETTQHLPNVDVARTEGYVVAYARAIGATVLLRGIRGVTDAAYETSLANANLALAPEVTTLFVPAHPELSEVSSSRLKELARSGGEISRFCPDGVEARVRARVGGDGATILREAAHDPHV